MSGSLAFCSVTRGLPVSTVLMGFSLYNRRAFCEGGICADEFREAPLRIPWGSLWMNEDPEGFLLYFSHIFLFGVILYAIQAEMSKPRPSFSHPYALSASVSSCGLFSALVRTPSSTEDKIWIETHSKSWPRSASRGFTRSLIQIQSRGSWAWTPAQRRGVSVY